MKQCRRGGDGRAPPSLPAATGRLACRHVTAQARTWRADPCSAAGACQLPFAVLQWPCLRPHWSGGWRPCHCCQCYCCCQPVCSYACWSPPAGKRASVSAAQPAGARPCRGRPRRQRRRLLSTWQCQTAAQHPGRAARRLQGWRQCVPVCVGGGEACGAPYLVRAGRHWIAARARTGAEGYSVVRIPWQHKAVVLEHEVVGFGGAGTQVGDAHLIARRDVLNGGHKGVWL